MWTGLAPEECGKENFPLSRACFLNLVSELRLYMYISANPKSPNHRAECRRKGSNCIVFFKRHRLSEIDRNQFFFLFFLNATYTAYNTILM